MDDSAKFCVCSECFHDEGLRLNAHQIGIADSTTCSNCGATIGRKLDTDRLAALAHRFFVWGSLLRCDYGAAPLIQFNKHQKTSIAAPSWLEADIQLIERTLGVGFFHDGPRLWMIGEVEPLKALADIGSSPAIIERILQEYPGLILRPEDKFYRIRKAPVSPADFHEYDSPPVAIAGNGRLDSPGFPVMYVSPDLEVCVHECRVTAEDDLYVATLSPVSPLRFLDLSALLTHEETTEFESLDIAVHMLFLAGSHSYPIARRISLAAHSAGFDGLVFPSYFSLLRLGVMPFETRYGLSTRLFAQYYPKYRDHEQAKTVPNIAIFGRPIKQSKVKIRCINKLVLHRVKYGIHFGPVGFA